MAYRIGVGGGGTELHTVKIWNIELFSESVLDQREGNLPKNKLIPVYIAKSDLHAFER